MKKIILVLALIFVYVLLSANSINDRNIKTNITEQTLSVDFGNDLDIKSIKVIDRNSNIIYETSNIKNNTIDIPIEYIQSGVYFFRIETNSGVIVERINILI
jgi:hypothetical protein